MMAPHERTPAAEGRGPNITIGHDDDELSVPAGRVPYKMAGEAFRDTVRRANLCRPALSLRTRRVLEAVLAATTSYSKLVDEVSVRELARTATGDDDPNGRARTWVGESLAVLAELGLIGADPNGARGRGARVRVRVFHPSEGLLATTGVANNPVNGHDGGGQYGPEPVDNEINGHVSSKEWPRFETVNGHDGGGTPRSNLEVGLARAAAIEHLKVKTRCRAETAATVVDELLAEGHDLTAISAAVDQADPGTKPWMVANTVRGNTRPESDPARPPIPERHRCPVCHRLDVDCLGIHGEDDL